MSKEYPCMRSALMVMLVLVGCGTTPNPKSCLDNHCSDPDLPFCDADGAIGGEPNTCIAVNCMPNQFEECRGDRALTCNDRGDNYDLVDCEFGCGNAGCNECTTPECEKRIVPMYLPTICDTVSGAADLTLATDTTLDTSDPLKCSTTVDQPGAPGICVIRHPTITLKRGNTLTVVGTRTLALVADHQLLIDGILDASASRFVAGPGGQFATSGVSSEAGGGAGYRHPGGAAGDAATLGGAANGGSIGDNPTTITKLFGGRSSIAGPSFANGGGGVTLISCRGTVSVPGLVDVGGGGGLKGSFTGATYFSPGGGGSGGTVVLQGVYVTVGGEIYANGGGGGGGGALAESGTDGTRSKLPAPGGAASGTEGGRGGTELPPTGGFPSTRPGAGGGSAGYIVIYTPADVVPTLTPVAVSPPIEPKQNVGTN